MHTQNSHPDTERLTGQTEGSEQVLLPAAEKKQFVEPTVSVPVDVLEATTFFQQPTLESATT